MGKPSSPSPQSLALVFRSPPPTYHLQPASFVFKDIPASFLHFLKLLVLSLPVGGDISSRALMPAKCPFYPASLKYSRQSAGTRRKRAIHHSPFIIQHCRSPTYYPSLSSPICQETWSPLPAGISGRTWDARINESAGIQIKWEAPLRCSYRCHLRGLVIPAKAGIYSPNLWKCADLGVDSRRLTGMTGGSSGSPFQMTPAPWRQEP
jgi:hypothetical protein